MTPQEIHAMLARALPVFGLACSLLAVAACKPEPIVVEGENRPATSTGGSGRDALRIVGSSTVYPFAAAAAEHFGRSGHKSPIIEATGTGGGFKLFCAGVGPSHPDIANASRAMKGSEREGCESHGVGEVVEVPIGYDGIVLASARTGRPLQLTRRHLFLALAKEIPTANGQLAPNPHATWRDVDPSLPATEIEVYGPPPTSGTRDAFVELIMQEGCKTFDWIAALEKGDEDRFKQICHAVREDGAFVEAGENDNLIVQKLEANPAAAGIFGYSFLDENRDQVQGATIEGVEPTFDRIANLDYPVARPLFVYVKRSHVGVIPGIPEFVAELTGERAVGPEGYLTQMGLIPLPAERQQQARQTAAALAGPAGG
jgi:phosphate transport system substrate-binding protein